MEVWKKAFCWIDKLLKKGDILKKNIKYIAIISLAILIWLVWTNINIQTSEFIVKDKKIPENFNGFTVAVVSDLHNYDWGEKLLDLIKDSKPNIIAITGDLVDSRTPSYEISLDFVKKAMKISPVYYVTGNHEAVLDDFEEFEKSLGEVGVILLDDKSQLLEIEGEIINIAGVKDPLFKSYGRTHSEVINESLEGILSTEYYNIVLSHRPEQFETYVKNRANLVLSGHAHGGQVRIPFIGGVIAPNQGFFPKYTAGMYSEKGTNMIVSRGLGNSVVPVRVNNMPEFVVVRLYKDNG